VVALARQPLQPSSINVRYLRIEASVPPILRFTLATCDVGVGFKVWTQTRCNQPPAPSLVPRSAHKG
jgi:hypothetical protein